MPDEAKKSKKGGSNFGGPRVFRLSLLSDIATSINPWSWTFGDSSLFTVNLGKSNAPAAEARILEEVGSYGRQLGRMGEALAVIIDWAESQGLPEHPAIVELKLQLEHIELIRRQEEAADTPEND